MVQSAVLECSIISFRGERFNCFTEVLCAGLTGSGQHQTCPVPPRAGAPSSGPGSACLGLDSPPLHTAPPATCKMHVLMHKQQFIAAKV